VPLRPLSQYKGSSASLVGATLDPEEALARKVGPSASGGRFENDFQSLKGHWVVALEGARGEAPASAAGGASGWRLTYHDVLGGAWHSDTDAVYTVVELPKCVRVVVVVVVVLLLPAAAKPAPHELILLLLLPLPLPIPLPMPLPLPLPTHPPRPSRYGDLWVGGAKLEAVPGQERFLGPCHGYNLTTAGSGGDGREANDCAHNYGVAPAAGMRTADGAKAARNAVRGGLVYVPVDGYVGKDVFTYAAVVGGVAGDAAKYVVDVKRCRGKARARPLAPGLCSCEGPLFAKSAVKQERCADAVAAACAGVGNAWEDALGSGAARLCAACPGSGMLARGYADLGAGCLAELGDLLAREGACGGGGASCAEEVAFGAGVEAVGALGG